MKSVSLQKKMTFICLAALGGMLAIGLVVVKIITSVYDTRLYQSSVFELEYFCSLVENEVEAVEKLTFEVAMDSEFQRQLNEMMGSTSDLQLRWNAMGSFRDKMSVETVKDYVITDIFYDDKRDAPYVVQNSGIRIPDEMYMEFLEKAEEAAGAYVYLPPREDYPFILSGRNIRERLNYTLDYLGTLVIAYDIRAIINKNRGSLNGGDNNLCIFTGDSLIYNSSPESLIEIPRLKGDSGYEIINRNDVKYFRCYLKSPTYGWIFVSECSYENIYHTTVIITRVLVLAMIGLFLVLALVLRRICKIITLPLNNLAESMRIVENGDFELASRILLPVRTQDEVGLLNQEFHIMLDKIMVLIHENYEKQITLMDSRYKALQAQINPHFLYNTLNSVGWMIKAERNSEAQKMIIALGSLLRAAFREEQFSTLGEELELLEHYIYIQKIRYDGRVEFILEADEEVLGGRVPRLSLQPLVENALNYGAEYTAAKCVIRICAYMDGKRIKIQVEDNGAGMSRERLEEVRSFRMQPRQNGIGLKNINQRLELIYDQDYQFLINSEADVGTVIIIDIPWRDHRDV